jgi:protein-tyrosine phosphatase
VIENRYTILCVCLGNICRSPVAEALLQKQIEQVESLKGIIVDSAGTSGLHAGELPDPRTRKNALHHGIELTHRSRQIIEQDFFTADLILAMDSQNLKDLRKLKPVDSTARIQLITDYDPRKSDGVPDPYYQSEPAFEEVYKICERCAVELVKELISQQNIY